MRRAIPWKRFGDLPGRPFGGGMGRDVEIKGVTPVMGQDHENKQQAKAHRRHHQEIRRKPILCVPLINVTSTNLLTTSYVFDVWRTCLTGAFSTGWR